MNAGAIIVVQQRRAVERLRARGCTDPEAARTLEELGVRPNFGVRALVRHGVLVDQGAGRFWLDEGAWSEFEARRRRIVLAMLLIAAVVVVVLLVADAR